MSSISELKLQTKKAREILNKQYEVDLANLLKKQNVAIEKIESTKNAELEDKTAFARKIVSEQDTDTSDPLSGFKYGNLQVTYYLNKKVTTYTSHDSCSGQLGCYPGCSGKKVITYRARVHDTCVNPDCKPITFTETNAFLIEYFRLKEGIDIILAINQFEQDYIYRNANSICTCDTHNHKRCCKFHEFITKHVETGDPRMIGEVYKLIKRSKFIPINVEGMLTIYKAIHQRNPDYLKAIIKGAISNVQAIDECIYKNTMYDVDSIVAILIDQTSESVYNKKFYVLLNYSMCNKHILYGTRGTVDTNEKCSITGIFSSTTLREKPTFAMKDYCKRDSFLAAVTFNGTSYKKFNTGLLFCNGDITADNAIISYYKGTISNFQVVTSLSKAINSYPVDYINNKNIVQLFDFMANSEIYKTDIKGLESAAKRFDGKPIIDLMSKYGNLIEQFSTTDTFTKMSAF